MPDYPEQDTSSLALQGGLKGRFAGDFCVLQSSIDALDRYLQQQGTPEMRRVTAQMLQEMSCRVQRLERLSDHAAELALGSALRGLREKTLLNLTEYLTAACGCARQELALHESALQISLPAEKNAAPLWAQADAGLLDALLANLITNAAGVRGCAQVELQAGPGAQLFYRDDGPGLAPDGVLLLEQGAISRELAAGGATGLLLIREYTAALGWELRVEKGPGLVLRFSIPLVQMGKEACQTMRASAQEQAARKTRTAACFKRELGAVL